MDEAAHTLDDYLRNRLAGWFCVDIAKSHLIIYYDEDECQFTPKVPSLWEGYRVELVNSGTPTIGGGNHD